MDEEMEMEEEIIEVYDVVEIDFDYEFDAARFIDFTRPESESESQLAQSWFLLAPEYPPSPFIAELFPLNGLNSEHVDASPKSKYYERLVMNDDDDDDDVDIAQQTEHCEQDEACGEEGSQVLLQKLYDGTFLNSQNRAECLYGGPPRGLKFFDHVAHDNKKTKSKLLAKPCMRKSSTLMKPTASQLAKQNQQRQANGSRLQKNENNSGVHCGIESQASKRQKLDGGLLRRIVDMKQPANNLTHKLPKKDAALQGMNSQTKLRITIPREPDLATAHRADRTRSTSSKVMDNPAATTCRFRARPLNKKILEAPVPPVPRRTTQHLPDPKVRHQSIMGLNKVTADRTLEIGKRDEKGYGSMATPKLAIHQVVHSFKARPLDRKILASRGDIGVFRNNKRDITVPKEFAFQTSKRTQQNLPTELFSKLSLAGDSQPKNCPQANLPQRTSIPAKVSKENRWESCHQNHQIITHQVKVKRDTPSGKDSKERLPVASGVIGEASPRNGTDRLIGSWRQQ